MAQQHLEDNSQTRMLLSDIAFASVGLFFQRIGANYAHCHGLGHWHFDFIPFSVTLFAIFMSLAIRPFRSFPTIRSRIVLFTTLLWLLCETAGLGIWVACYGS